jgi:hypothetical protein
MASIYTTAGFAATWQTDVPPSERMYKIRFMTIDGWITCAGLMGIGNLSVLYA